MNLLLLLTALFASLTGTGSGDRVVRQVQGVAVVRAAGVAQAAVQPSQRVAQVHAAAISARPDRAAQALPEAALLPTCYLPFERRLE
ncbi:hypothetical protein [Sphingomonas sp. M1-B02]|uniref:hypothetical protein n=1 Tax=Sphingomonas sp. M1-B02 TaxID=3114300 RepID=UPI0022409F40|nr:hypothetical protein [Sphingomonas sp. S6-11]UZK67143.1 hypothetical protein OKW87_04745 [Sphingomonas sp. S6-11]